VNSPNETRKRDRNVEKKRDKRQRRRDEDEGLRTREPCELTAPSVRKLQLFGSSPLSQPHLNIIPSDFIPSIALIYPGCATFGVTTVFGTVTWLRSILLHTNIPPS
jgi:hypothetical protein